MKNTNVIGFVHFMSILSFSSLLILSVSAQTRKTKSTDVEALRLLEANLGFVNNTDPCLPKPYSWIKCSSDNTPRITTIDLHDQKIYWTPLLDFGPMDALETLDFSGNIFNQEFPDFLANYPKLKVLNLAENFFSGTIPTSLQKNNVNVTVTGLQASYLCYSDEDKCETATGTGTSTPTTRKSKKKLPIILGTVIPIFVIFWAIAAFLAIKRQKRNSGAGQTDETPAPALPL